MFQLHVQPQVLLQYSTCSVQQCCYNTATNMLPQGKNRFSNVFKFCDLLSITDNFCQEAVPLEKRYQFRKLVTTKWVVEQTESCRILIQFEIKDRYKKSCDKYHGHYKLPCPIISLWPAWHFVGRPTLFVEIQSCPRSLNLEGDCIHRFVYGTHIHIRTYTVYQCIYYILIYVYIYILFLAVHFAVVILMHALPHAMKPMGPRSKKTFETNREPFFQKFGDLSG